MGTLKKGITGNYSGKIGNLVFYTLNGKNVVRTIGKVTTAPSLLQMQNRMEMRVVNGFINPIKEFINIGFALLAKRTVQNAHNLAVSCNKRFAMEGDYPDVTINYPNVLVTQGDMLPALSPQVTLTLNGLNFTWECPPKLNWPRQNDQVMLLAYFPLLEKAVYLLSGADRSIQSQTLFLSQNLSANYMEVYISFIAENRKSVATSTYLKSFNK